MMIAAFLCTNLLTFGQDGLMAANLRPERAEGSSTADTAAPAEARNPITDDGHAGDELLGTRQLMLAFSAPEARACSVDILNERGQCVRTFAFAETSARKAVPVSVDGLAQGRYVARIARDGQVHVVRFRR